MIEDTRRAVYEHFQALWHGWCPKPAKEQALPTIEEQYEEHPFLFTRNREGEWQVNRHGTVFSPVWTDLSPADSAALDRLTGRKL